MCALKFVYRLAEPERDEGTGRETRRWKKSSEIRLIKIFE